MPQHIGIVACSAEGAALCYRTICIEGAQLLGPHDHPEVSMHTHALARYMQRIYRGDWQGVGELMLSSANKLASAGAQFLICPDNEATWTSRPASNCANALSKDACEGR
jgi:aspartate racemase